MALSMLPFLTTLLLGLGIPWCFLREKDQAAGRIHPLNRSGYIKWLIGTFVLAQIGGFVGAMLIAPGSITGRQFGLAITLSWLATRRLRDIGLSPRLAILGLSPPLAITGSIVLCFIPTEAPQERE